MTKQESSLSDSSDSSRLTGQLGPGAIVFMVVAAAAPLTVMAGAVPIGISAGNGAAFPASYIVCTVILLFFAVGFTAMAKHLSGAGAFYTYITHGLGRHFGLGSAYLALLSYTAVQGAMYGFVGAAIDDFSVQHGGPSLPWYVWALAVAAVVGILGYRHIDLSGKVLGVLLVCEVGIVLAMDAAVIGRGGGPDGVSTAMLQPGEFLSGAPGIAMIFAVAGFIGFEATAVFRDEARDPARTIPRATYMALIIIGGFYALSSWAMISAWGDEGAVSLATQDPEGMITETAVKYLGTFAGDLVQVLLLTSLFAALLSFHNVLARYFFSLGNSSALPAACGRSHRKHHSPYIASIAQTGSAIALIAVAVLAGLDPVTEMFAWLAGVSSVGIIALMTLTSLAVLVYFRRTRTDHRVWNTLIAPGLGLAGLAILFTMTVTNLPLLVGGSTSLAVVISIILIGTFAGGAVFALMRPAAARTNTDSPKPFEPKPPTPTDIDKERTR